MLEPYCAKTRYVSLDAQSPDPDVIEAAADIIRCGRLVAFPTETVYGLGANAFSAEAINRIYRAKGRPASDPLIAHIGQIEQLQDVAVDIPNIARLLFERFAPGPLTLVLRKHEDIPAKLTAGMDTVAVRMPDHAVALALIRAARVPLAAPSANKFSRPSPTNGQHVLNDLDGSVDMILDAGNATIGVESTIVSLVGAVPQLLRPGGVSFEDLRGIVPDIIYRPRYLCDDDNAAPAPGSLLKHYSPRAKVLLFRGNDDEAVFAAMREHIRPGSNVGAMLMDADVAQLDGLQVKVANLGANLDQAALRLFAALRELDQMGVAEILARAPQPQGLGLAIGDRLLRAAVGNVIEVKPPRHPRML